MPTLLTTSRLQTLNLGCLAAWHIARLLRARPCSAPLRAIVVQVASPAGKSKSGGDTSRLEERLREAERQKTLLQVRTVGCYSIADGFCRDAMAASGLHAAHKEDVHVLHEVQLWSRAKRTAAHPCSISETCCEGQNRSCSKF
jgi:hypothetical protein